MKETGRTMPVRTLEDIVTRSSTYRPSREMLAGIYQARDIMQACDLVNVLGLTGQTDPVLLHAFMADRILKTRLYDLEWAVHSPEFLLTSKQEAADDKKRESLQASLAKLGEEREDIVREFYPDYKGRLRARNLELAANDLIARGSISVDDGKHDPYTDISISDELLENWALRWKDKFKAKKRYTARQKHLRYLL